MQMQGQFQYDPPVITVEEWIEMKDFPNKEDILARMEQDRVNKKQQDAQALEGQIMQVVGQAQQMRGQGMAEEQIQQQLSPMIQEVIQATFTSGTKQGSADVMQNSAPGGTTSPTAMGNMTQG
jgi:phage gp29-like protein